jgi:hypothetical protein
MQRAQVANNIRVGTAAATFMAADAGMMGEEAIIFCGPRFGHWPHRDIFCFAVDFPPDRTGGDSRLKIHPNRRSANA